MDKLIAQARKHLAKCDEILTENDKLLADLEEKLRNSRKPSEELGWYRSDVAIEKR